MRLHVKFLFFCIIGAIGVLIELAVFNILFYFDALFILSKTVGVLSGITFAFFMNRHITFAKGHKRLIKQVHKHAIVYSIGFVVSVVSSVIIKNLLPEGDLYANIAVLTGVAIAVPVNFLGSHYWTFN